MALIAGRAALVFRIRRGRDSAFGKNADLFGEPAWDIMLDMFDADGSGRRIAISQAGVASNIPASTALRIVGILEDRGFLTRVNDPDDKRRAYLYLTDKGREAMRVALSWKEG